MKLYAVVPTHGLHTKLLAETHLISCVGLILVLLWLVLTNSLYNIGKVSTSVLLYVLLVLEGLKYQYYRSKIPRKPDQHKKPKADDLSHRLLYSSLYIGYLGFVGVIFGAPLLGHFEECYTFALIVFTLAVLPTVLYLGSGGPDWLLGSLVSLNVDPNLKPFLSIGQLTLFGAWLGAMVIPLDWNKPYQIWPIPCILGAVIGNLVGNSALLAGYLLDPKSKKKIKNEC